MVTVAFPVSAEEACAYLADPARRPEWQSSLRSVEVRDPGPPHLGQRWVDVTVPGLRAAMETTDYQPGARWQETGRWRGFTARVTLTFSETADGCEVTVSARVAGAGLARPLGLPLTALGLLAGRSDLQRAARALAGAD